MFPQRIGRYQVLGKLASGGMGEILLARLAGPADFRRAVVIKRILPEYARQRSFVTMLLDEARVAATIRHPNVAQVQELVEEEGEVFLVLEYVAGENLASVLRRTHAMGEPLAPELVAHVIAEACAGLHAAHELVTEDGKRQNLVHRDVSPQNLLVAYDGHVKLLDFGIALTEHRLTRTEAGNLKGKLSYMSPEQVTGKPLERRSDIFSMGVVLYELATGRLLFQRASHAHTVAAICQEPALPPSRLNPKICRDLEKVILRALSKRPDDRYATAAEMRMELLEVARALTSPVEMLAAQMQRLFTDRISEKTELLRCVRDEESIPPLPPDEVEVTVAIPEVPIVPASTRLRTTRGGVLGVSLLTVVAISATALSVTGRSPRATTTNSTTLTSNSATLVASAASTTDTAPAESTVVIRIASHPPGAHVIADGEMRGETPLELRLPRGNAPVAIELGSRGYLPSREVIVPDSDHTLVLELTRAGKTYARPRTRPALSDSVSRPTPSASARGFRRFE